MTYDQPTNPVTPPARPAGSVPPSPHEQVAAAFGTPTGDELTDLVGERLAELEPSKPNAEEIYDSLNYFDEIAVKNTFGEELLALKQRKNAFMRALIYSDLRKNHGLKDKAAQERVFMMLNGEVQTWFAVAEQQAPKCTTKGCPCVEHAQEDEDDDEDPTELLS